jgi:hypothetical protein
MSTHAADQASVSPAWMVAARGARYVKEEQIKSAGEELSKLPSELLPVAETLLNGLAATGLSPAGLREAGVKLEAALPSLSSRVPGPPGQDPNQRRVTRCALVVFHGRVQLIAKMIAAEPSPKQNAVELLRVIRSIRPSLQGASIGIAIEEEARIGLGHALFDEALQTVSASAG